MLLKKIIHKAFAYLKRIEAWSVEGVGVTIYGGVGGTENESSRTLFSVWDTLHFKENTQAYHLNSAIGFEEWIDMEEILRRIRELFGAEYKNMRSLYPYLKTLADIGLMETTNVGGRRRWRKVALLAPLPTVKEEKEQISVRAKKKKSETN